MTTVRTNHAVSNSILKALGAGKHHTISNAEWANIKKTALSEVRASKNPKQTATDIKRSLVMGNKAADGELKTRIAEFVKGDLEKAVKSRQASLRNSNNSVSTWSGYGRSTGRTTPTRTYSPVS